MYKNKLYYTLCFTQTYPALHAESSYFMSSLCFSSTVPFYIALLKEPERLKNFIPSDCCCYCRAFDNKPF